MLNGRKKKRINIPSTLNIIILKKFFIKKSEKSQNSPLNRNRPSVRLAGFNSQSNARPGLRDYLFRAVQAMNLSSVVYSR